MRNLLIFVCITFSVLLVRCKPRTTDKSIPGTDTTATSPSNDDTLPTANASQTEEDSCIFNNDYKSLTMEWADELKASGFVWNHEMNSALKIADDDTIILSKGGCYHFGISAEWRLANDHHELTDSAYWIRKALRFAEECKYSDYVTFIKNRRIDRQETDNSSIVVYELLDTARITNIVYDGIVIQEKGKRKRLSISMYYN